MLIEAARRAEAAAKEMLACINAGSAPCAEVREALAVSKVFMAAGSAFQVGAAKVIAKPSAMATAAPRSSRTPPE